MSTIVVGVDGSQESIAALRHALREAALHGHAVRVVTAWHIPVVDGGFVPARPDPGDLERAAREAQKSALEAVAAERGDVPVEAVLREGDAAHILIEESEGAAQLVVGCRNLNFLGRLLSHSVSGHCSREAHCPVTVVHDG